MPPQPHGDNIEVPAAQEAEFKERYPYRTMSPEEYVARHAHLMPLFGIWRFKFRDAVLSRWLYEVHVNLHNRDKREACRQRFLSPEEIEEFRQIEYEDI